MKDTRTDWIRVAALLVAGLFAAAQFGKLTLTLDVAMTTYWRYAGWVPLLVSIVGLVGIAFGAVAGRSITSFGLKRSLVGALMVGGLLSLAQAILPSIWIFAALRIAEGFSHLAIVVAAPTLMSSFASDAQRPLVMGIWGLFFGISFALTALILPALLSFEGFGYGLVFASHGIGMIVIGCVLAFVLPSLPDAGKSAVRRSYWGEHRAIYSTPRLALPGVIFLWYTICFIALLAVLPEVLDLPIWVISALPLVSLIGTFGAGAACRYVAPPTVALLGFGGALVACVAVALHPEPVLSCFGLMLFLGIVPGACFAAIPHFNQTAEARARATGGLAQCGNVGTTFGTPVFVFAAHHGDRLGVALLLAVFCAIGIAATLALQGRVK